MADGSAEFRRIGGQTTLVRKRPLSRNSSLPSLARTVGATGGIGGAGSTQKGFKQRGILSEVVRVHQGMEVEACQRGPTGPAGNSMRKSASAGSFALSHRLRGVTDAAQPVAQKRLTMEVPPKVVEVYAHAPGERPRKVTVERRKKWFESLDIEDLLVERSITFRKMNWKDTQWLELGDFDNTDFDILTPDEWMQSSYDADGKPLPLRAQGLHLSEDGSGVWEECIVRRVEGRHFLVQWGSFPEVLPPNAEPVHISEELEGPAAPALARLNRLQILFRGEDPQLLADRITYAFKALQRAQSRAKLNFFIDNMPIDDIQCLDVDQVGKIIELAKNSAELRDTSIEPTANDLVREANLDFARTMNKIILLQQSAEEPSKQREEGGMAGNTVMKGLESMLGKGIDLDVLEEVGDNPFDRPVPWFALWPLPEYNFTEAFSNFCFASLNIKSEVVSTSVAVAKECLWVLEQCIYTTRFQKVMKMDQFRQLQRSSIAQMGHRVKETWASTLTKIIQDNFKNVGKGWFSIHETNPETYRQGKMKKLLAVVRFMMQDTLRYFALDSVADYASSVEGFCPESVQVKSLLDVQCSFPERSEGAPPARRGGSLELRPPGRSPPPLSEGEVLLKPGDGLFVMEVKQSEEGAAFNYSSDSYAAVEAVLEVLDQGLQGIHGVPQPDAQIVPQLFKTVVHKQVLSTVDANDSWVKNRRVKLKEAVTAALPPLQDYLQLFEAHTALLKLDPKEFVREKADADIATEEARHLIVEHLAKEKEIMEAIPDTIPVGLFEVSCAEIRKVLAGRHKAVADRLIELLINRFREGAQEITDAFSGFFASLRRQPKDIEGVTQLRDYMSTLPSEMTKLASDMKRVAVCYTTLEQFGVLHTADDSYQRWRVFGCPKQAHDLMERTEAELQEYEQGFLNMQIDEQAEFNENLADLQGIIENFAQYDDMEKVSEIYENVESVNDRLKQAAAQAKLFNSREALFGRDITDYTMLQSLNKEWEPFSQLWVTTYHWLKDSKEWIEGPFGQIDAKYCESSVSNGAKTLLKTVRAFEKREASETVLEIAQKIKTEIDAFAPNVPLVVGLRNSGMCERHWEQVSTLVGTQVNPEMEDFSLKHFLDLGMVAHSDKIVDIGDHSGKELAIETQLNNMKKAWNAVYFDCKETYRTTNTYILKGAEDVMTILDEQVVLTQAMQFSPFNKPFKADIDEWNDKLSYISECLDQWLKVQRAWMYLQPIFDSPDIMKQLPTEGKKFRVVDGKWRSVMGRVHSNSHALTACTQEGLVDTWVQANNDLDIVQKGLDDYLETKRQAFARFYFLSNDELLEILSQTKDPLRVQPFLTKVFEAMKQLTFTSDLVATQMHSKEGEVIDFVRGVKTTNRNVEVWMTDVEEQMLVAVREVVKFGVESYVEVPRAEWVLQNPGQVVLNASQVHWTAEVEQAIREDAVQAYFQKLSEQLLDLVRLVRGNLTKLQRMSIGALVVIDVHAMDTVERLATQKINDLMAFEWIAQLRYYWEVDDRNAEHLWVRMVQTPFPYGYEYLGNSFRLVITPLTDMCYMTLMGAQSLNLGGAPQGPAGTGKTETTKDLAKALAKTCVVFNCSPEMDYVMVGKFFKGLASSGAWCCFDEFNRIYIEVLSVIAQQLLQLFSAKREIASYNHTVELDFDATLIVMKPTFNVFITMNPGYAGRSDLPDNLAALFRPMAMMVPNYAMIGEISFYAFGFEEGRHLAQKMVTTFQLCSEQLSAQFHYDYGMRAVKTVIEAAGLNKRKYPDQSEAQILLRALRDVNVPKFLKDDLPLFDNIISDLFPGVQRPEMSYGKLEDACVKNSVEHHLQPTEYFVKKQFELFDMIQVRHGMMLVGPTGGGKTSCYRTLQQACTSLFDKEDPESPYQKVHVHVLNPKAITQNQLYGSFDEVTREWSDGVAAELIRTATRDAANPDHHWVMFDGPVDALWIESMNTVLDDNKKLCLVSGEIIALTPKMRIQFEVEDLEVASPATVSRCGMIYMEPESLGSQPFFDSWLEVLPETFVYKPNIKVELRRLCEEVVQPTLTYVRKCCGEVVGTKDNNMIQSLFRLLDSYFVGYVPNELQAAATFKEQVAELEPCILPLFYFCLLWSLGATCTSNTRNGFSDFLWGMLSPAHHEAVAPKMRELHIAEPPLQQGIVLGDGGPFQGLEAGCSFYDFFYNREAKAWVPWMDTIPAYSVPKNARYEEIVVPSMDSVRLMYIFQLLVMHDKHVLCPGPTGTGKSVNITLWLQKQAPDNFQGVFINFSAQTHVNQLQDLIDSKLEKRRRGVFGPPAGKKMVLFVDDLNMPLKEYYGAQPPIELLRQWHDHHGWFNRKELVKFNIVDIIMVSAMGPPGGGRTFITERLKRHYSTTAYTEFQETSIKQIFSCISEYFFTPFEEPVQALIQPMIAATIGVFTQSLENLLPTPAKSHYLFNLRDIWKVFLGLCSLNAKKTSDPIGVARCWCHEVQRVFGDRLTDAKDLEWLRSQVGHHLVHSFGMQEADIFVRDRLIFASFMSQDAEGRIYEEVTDLQAMKESIEEFLEDYNTIHTATMPLVMFLDACEHCARQCRVLTQPAGNMLALGVGGSGRQSLSRLSTHICEAECFQIKVSKGYGMPEFKDDLKSCLLACGVEDKVQIFLFCDTQIVKDDFVEAINNVLNSGDVPNLYAVEDFEAIASSCRQLCTTLGMQPTKANLFSAYLTRVKKNVHVVLAFSPVGDSFRNRLLMFPSLVNCCTIDWFHPWPAEALYSVAKQQLTGQNLNLPDLEGSLQMFQAIHQSVEVSAKDFLNKTQRQVHVTPTSYLELLNSFLTILADKRKEVGTAEHRYRIGLSKIGDAEQQVSGLQQMLQEKKPRLEETQNQVAEMMKVIQQDKADATEVSEEVAKEKAEAEVKATETQIMKDDAERDLNEALPLLDQAVQCLKKLKAAHIQEVKVLPNPPAGVRLACEAICIMFGYKPVKKTDPATQKKYDDYWETSQKQLLPDPKKLLDELFEYDKDNIPDKIIQAMEPYMEREDFDPAAIKKASVACEAMCLWARAMYKYHFVAKAVEPKRVLLREAEANLEECQAKLRASMARLHEVESKIAALEAEYEMQTAKARALQEDMDLCVIKLERAHKLIGGLGGEKARWSSNVQTLKEQLELLPGDCIVAAGMVSYAGPFTSAFRVQLEENWLQGLTRLGIAHNAQCSMRAVLGDPVKIQQWVVCSLPNDALSIENGIIIDRTRRWPLMIDPQRQANRFIKNMGKEIETGLDVGKLSEKNFLRTVELAIQFGKWLLLENIGIALDPALEPVLMQQKIKDGGGYSIKLGDKSVTYSDTFKFFMTTTLPNPHYSPETSVKVTLLNFAITPSGLEDQMLGIVVARERPDLEEQKNELVVQNAKMNKTLKEIEDDILKLLATSTGDVLEDDVLVNKVTSSKQVAAEIAEKQGTARLTEQTIDEARESYRPVAYRTSVLFFCIVELANIDPMYQYSLQWFQQLFGQAIDQAPKSSTLEERLEALKDAFTEALYQAICRGLFEKDKPLFSFALCLRIIGGSGEVDDAELRFLLVGPTADLVENGPPIPADWVGKQRWNEILAVSQLPAFEGFDGYFTKNISRFKVLYDSVEADKAAMPGHWERKLTPLQKLCFIRAFRLDCLKSAVVTFIATKIGQKFVDPPTFDIARSFADSTNTTPLVFILSSGTDPVADVIVFADKLGMSKRFDSISLGQGQGPKAKKLIEAAQSTGGWVLLSNCHLMESWMSTLEAIVEQLNPDTMSSNFRLWLTSMPAKTFPVMVLQNGVKMTNQPPAGLRANLLRSYSAIQDKLWEESIRPDVFKTLLFGFCFFHAVVQDRRKFGPIGWNTPYGFTPEDLQVCRQQLMAFVNQYEEVPYKVLNFLGAQINYGGRVTDDKDKLLITTILQTYICKETVELRENYKYSTSGKYFAPQADTVEDYITYIRGMPLDPMPEAFGLHENCNITCAQDGALVLLSGMQSMVQLSGGGEGGQSPEAGMDSTAASIQERLPTPFRLDLCEEKFPTKYEESMNTVVKQECLRYNKLLKAMEESLKDFRRAIKGLIVMTVTLEATGKSMFVNEVPELWAKKGPLSLKPLSSWYLDILARVQFFQTWYDLGRSPPCFWISGIFFPQAFFTGAMQNFARKYNEEIDLLSFSHTILGEVANPVAELVVAPDDGVYVYGMFLEGARWDLHRHRLDDSRAKELFTEVPSIWFKPVKSRVPNPLDYRCPTYKVVSRHGQLLTTGHSTNFVLYLELPTDQPVGKWIKAGVAAFLALKY